MTVLRTDIEKALEDLISNEEGMRFQGLAVVLAKQHWPELVACERKKDLGADAIGSRRVLGCSLTATLGKIKSDARKIKKNFPETTTLIFSTPEPVTNTTAQPWAKEIKEEFGYDLIVVSREDIVTSLLEPSNLALCRTHLGMPVEMSASVAEQIQHLRAAVADVVAAWSHPIEGKPLIELRAVRMDDAGRDTSDIMPLADTPTALARSGRIIIEAPAGRGKTTTLVQLANRYNSTEGIAILVDLPGWIQSGKGILQFISETLAFQSRGLTADALAQLHMQQPFSFLLNGWNEIAETDSAKGAQALRDLQRDFRSAGIVVATRSHHIVPPLSGASRLRLLPLNQAERDVYLEARLKERWRELRTILLGDAVLDDLTRTPFILSEVVALFEAGERIPKTKIGILAAAVKLHEQSQDHVNHLAVAPLGGRAAQYLTALAMVMTEAGSVTVTEQTARGIVSKVSAKLREEGQIANVPEPLDVIAGLTAHHLLERMPDSADTVRFEHQQYQEFYAASHLGRCIRDLANRAIRQEVMEFTKKYINEPAWTEPLRMVAEEVGALASQEPEDADAVKAGALLVSCAFDCDPVFGGEISFLCGPRIWKQVRSDINKRLRRLYESATSPREIAVAGMLATGSEEFGDILLPLLSSADQQVRLGTYRLWSDFHLSSLGADWQKTVTDWSQEIRAEFVSEIIHLGNGARFLVPFALADRSVKVRVAAIEALAWVSLEAMNERLTELDDWTFEAAARELPPEWLREPNRSRALTVFRKFYDEASDPLQRIRYLMHAGELGEADIGQRLKEDLANCEPARIKQLADFGLKPILEVIRGVDSEWVSQWVAGRIVDGTLWHEHWIIYVKGISQEMRAELLKPLTTQDLKHSRNGMSVLAASADAPLAKQVFERICELQQIISSDPGQRHEVEWAIMHQLDDLFRLLPSQIVAEGLSGELAPEVDPQELIVVSRLFSRSGREDHDLRKELPDTVRQALRGYFLRGIPVMLQQDDFYGSLKADLASALARVGEPQDISALRDLIRADIQRVRTGLEARAKGDLGPRGHGGVHSRANFHTRALTLLDPDHADTVLLELLTEPEYEQFAAGALLQLARLPVTSQPAVGPFGQKKSYKEIWEARKKPHAAGFDEERRVRYSEAIKRRVESAIDAAKKGEPVNDFRLKELTKVLAVLDAVSSGNLIIQALMVPGRFNGWQTAESLEILLFSGVTIPTEQTLSLFDRIVEQVRPNYYNSSNDRGLLIKALCLLPFVDQPAVGIRKVRTAIAELKIRGYELRDVIVALGHSRNDQALEAIQEIANDENTARSIGEAYIEALAALDTKEANEILLSLVDPELRVRFDPTFERPETVAARLAELAGRPTEIRERLFQLCSMNVPEPKRSLLAKIVACLGTPEAMIASLNLLDDDTERSIPYDIWKQFEDAFVERKPYGQNTNSYTLAPRSSNEVRERLFRMSQHDKKRAKAATALLKQIDVWRLEYGRPLGEPRSVEIELKSTDTAAAGAESKRYS